MGLSFSLWYFGLITLPLLLLLVPMTIFLVRWITFPIDLLTKTAQQFEAGDFAARTTFGLGESQKFISLSNAMNAMMDKIQGTNQEVERRIIDHKKTLQQAEASHQNLFESSPDAVLVLSNDAVIDCNPAAITMFGVDNRNDLLALHPGQLSPSFQMNGEESQVAANRKIQQTLKDGHVAFDWLHHRLDTGQTFIAEVLLNRIDNNGKILVQGTVRDITERKKSENYEQFRSQILEILAGTHTLVHTLQSIAIGVERLHPKMLCSILLLGKEKKYFTQGVGPSLPSFFNDALYHVEIGPGVGSCGTAAFIGERIVVEDIASHPYWANFTALALQADLAACWSEPIKSSTNEVLGTFAIYHRNINTPSSQDIKLIEQCARLASIAIEKNRLAEKLKESEEHYRLLTEGATDVVWKMDLANRFTYISPADERLRGYTADEVVGRHVFSLLTEDGIATLRKKAIERQEKERNGIQTGPMIFDLQQHCKDGSLIWTEVLSNPIHDSLGHVSGYQGMTRDITNRRMADEELRIAAIAFESQEGMYITNTAWDFLRVNKAFTEITGYSAQEAIGKKPSMLRSGRHDDFFFAEMKNRLEKHGAWQGEIWDTRKNGETFPALLTITVVKDDAGQVSHYVGTFTDISSRKTAEEKIMSLAFYDPLTLLPNRRLLMDRLEQAMAGSARHQRKGALLFVDLDNFKKLNDTLGHDKGDILLQQVAQRLVTCTRDTDTVARFGGDEFIIMLEEISEEPIEAAMHAEAVGEKILTALNRGYQLAGIEHRSTPSIGITLFGETREAIEEPIKRADLAMYQAKAAGRNTLRFFDPKMQAVVSAHVALEEALRDAISANQFLLHYQVQVTYEGKYIGAEALLRWKHPARGMVSPAEFVPLAEETGLILPLGSWVLETACIQLAIWANDPELAHLTLAVNVSARQFHQDDFVDQVLDVIERTNANPRRLKLELTEGMLVSNVEDVIAKILAIKEHGVDFSLDDFGTGFSSLGYLKRLPLDQLKIDQSFVRDILLDPHDAAISKMVIVLAENLGLSVIAEGVETQEQRDFLASQGCLAYQGYFFSRPLPLLEFEEFIKKTIH